MQTSSERYEKELLAALRPQYEEQGYRFIVSPTAEEIPPFLKEYRPDAIAISDKGSVIIEVKFRRAPQHQARLSEIATLVDRHPGWKFRVYYGSPSAPQLYARPKKTEIQTQFGEAKLLAESHHLRAAFILTWAALEAIARALDKEAEKVRAMMPRELINWLEQEGYIDPTTRRSLRDLVQIRNGVVHGSTEIAVEQRHCDVLMAVVSSLLDQIAE